MFTSAFFKEKCYFSYTQHMVLYHICVLQASWGILYESNIFRILIDLAFYLWME